MPEISRKNIRLQGYDYTKNGVYFITICCQNRMPLFEQSEVKKMVDLWLWKLEENYQHVVLDAYIVMPDHIHFILIKTEKDEIPLSRMMTWFKTMTTNAYIKGVRNNGWLTFEKRMWQRNYFEHIVRNDRDLNEKREYIINNPLKHQNKTCIPLYES